VIELLVAPARGMDRSDDALELVGGAPHLVVRPLPGMSWTKDNGQPA
jgi:hypothetical protein